MPTLSVEADHARLVVVCVVPDAVKLAGADGACVSGGVRVVTFTVLPAAEMFPAASIALTEKPYVVLAVNPVTV